MKFRTSLIAIFLLAGCASQQKASDAALYTDIKGPSKATGDCGGYAFWLNNENGQLKSGEMAEFEGGCSLQKKKLLEVTHNPATGRLTFLAPSSNPNEFLKFEGLISERKLIGLIGPVEKTTQKPLTPYLAKNQRTFDLTDQQQFFKVLPQNSSK